MTQHASSKPKLWRCGREQLKPHTLKWVYVAIVGDAECGGICLDYVDGEPIPLAEAEIGDLLPPYHPNCACSFVSWEEKVEVPLDEEY